MLKITIHETPDAVVIQPEGRIAGLWAAELSKTWLETAPRLAARKLSFDLRNVTYADVDGKKVLQDIYSLTGAELVTGTPWTQYLAQEITGQLRNRMNKEL